MIPEPLLDINDVKKWHDWLAKNHDTAKEIWLVYYKKASGKPRVEYNDAVDEALCFGWIDSTVKTIDDERFCQRFTPRKPKSKVSEMNKERMRRLIAAGRMTEAGLKAVEKVFDPFKDEPLVVAPDILKALKANPQAWDHFQKFDEGYKKVRIGYLESRRPG